jgi:hypothetical protein
LRSAVFEGGFVDVADSNASAFGQEALCDDAPDTSDASGAEQPSVAQTEVRPGSPLNGMTPSFGRHSAMDENATSTNGAKRPPVFATRIFGEAAVEHLAGL